jgi:Leucine-rich repeat (LRR) protein
MPRDDDELHDESISSVDLEQTQNSGVNHLPSVEEYKNQVAITERRTPSKISRKREARVIWTIACFVVVAVISIAIGVSVGKSSSNGSSDAQSQADATNVPVGVSTTPPKAGVDQGEARLNSILARVETLGWSTSAALNTPGSPQHRAAAWLANIDEMGIRIDDDSVEFRQRYALAVFYFALKKDGRSWYANKALPWFTEQPVCNWTASFETDTGGKRQMGVRCNGGNVVKELYFPGASASGLIPDEITLLYDLQALHLDENDLTTPLNPKLEKLLFLRDLGLSFNSINGTFPSFLGHMALKSLDLSHNGIHGSVGPITAWSDMEGLDLSYNDIEDDINRFSELTNVRYLFLAGNKFVGRLESDILAAWAKIEALDISQNDLEGRLPDNLFLLSSLRILDLHGNYFTGNLPSQAIDDTRILELLALHDNKLDGALDVVANLRNLIHLDLSNNGFSGWLPTFVALEKLQYLYLFNLTNLQAGPVNTAVDNMPNLVDLSLQNSRRTGTIPSELGMASNLVLLDLARNELTGEIPSELGDLSTLSFLFLQQNHLNGTMPNSLSKLSFLDSLVVDRNDLEGPPGTICTSKPLLLKNFIADCDEIVCPKDSCCTICCEDGDNETSTLCHDQVWNGQLDPVPDFDYKRTQYQFYDGGVVFPVQQDVSTNDDKWNMWNFGS